MGNRIFSAAERVAILKAIPNKPTGVIFAFGGMEFDLLALPNATFLEILEIIEAAQQIGRPSASEITRINDVLNVAGTKGRRLLEIAREILKSAAFYGQAKPKPDDVAVFDEWFDALPSLDLIKELAPSVLRAAGANAVVKDPSPAPTPIETRRRRKTATG